MADVEGKKELNKLPPFTLALVVITVVSICGFALLILYPQNIKIKQMQLNKQEASARLEEQKMVFPLYVKAQTLLKSEFTPKIILSEDPKGLERNRLGELSDFFNDICTRCGMEFSSNSLDIKSLNKDSDVVSMEMILAGDLFSFREFLIQTMKLPFFDQIETIRISTENELKTFQTKIRIRIEKI